MSEEKKRTIVSSCNDPYYCARAGSFDSREIRGMGAYDNIADCPDR